MIYLVELSQNLCFFGKNQFLAHLVHFHELGFFEFDLINTLDLLQILESLQILSIHLRLCRIFGFLADVLPTLFLLLDQG